MASLFSGEAALVTGAAGGLGRAIALVFAREGARLFLVDRAAEPLARIRAEAERAGAECRALAIDLGTRANCVTAVAAAVEAFGRLDVLCNNAAILSFDNTQDITVETWERTLAVNVSAPLYLSQAAIPHLLDASGNIVNIASSGGLIGTAYASAYSTSKAALIHLTRCMAMEFMGRPIRINAVAPGTMKTGIADGLAFPPEADTGLMARYAGVRPPVDPREVAEMVAFVASPRASAVHGACLAVDQGTSTG